MASIHMSSIVKRGLLARLAAMNLAPVTHAFASETYDFSGGAALITLYRTSGTGGREAEPLNEVYQISIHSSDLGATETIAAQLVANLDDQPLELESGRAADVAFIQDMGEDRDDDGVWTRALMFRVLSFPPAAV